MKGSTYFGAVAALVLTAGAAFGQVTSGNIAGVVKDATGAVVPNASVSIKSESTGVVSTVKANASGEYLVQNLLPAKYDITATSAGFAPTSLKGVNVTLNSTSTADVALQTGEQTSVIEVTASSASTLDTTTQNLTTTISNNEASVLPIATVGLGVLNASLLAPNVASAGGVGIGVGPSIGGQRPRNNNYTIEGIDDNDKSVTGPLLTVPNDAVGDFTLITSQFSPEFGHSSGGQFNTTIVSGTNKFHGRLYEYFQNRDLNAISALQGSTQSKGRLDFNRYGGQLGGPILRDKLFFFGNFERSTLGRNTQGFLCVPTAAGIATLNSLVGPYGLNANNVAQYAKYVPTANYEGGGQVTNANDQACFNEATGPQTLAVFQGTAQATGTPYVGGLNNGAVYGSGAETNIPLGNYLLSAPNFTNTDQATVGADYTISPTDTLRFRYIYFTEGFQDLAAQIPVFYQSLPLKQHLGTISEFHNFTSNLINEIRLGYSRSASTTPAGNFSYPGLDSFPNLTFYDQGGLNVGPDPNAPQSATQNLYQVVDNISYSRGRHTIKIGFDGRKYIAPETFTQRVRGDYEWDYATEFFHDLAPTNFGQRSTGNFIYYGDQTALYGYANDTWRVSPKLTVNYGLRYEFTSVPVGERAQQLNIAASVPGLITFSAPQPAYKNFAPRVGLAFAPDSKTSVRAGFGIAYDVLFDNLGLLSFPPQYSSTLNINTAGGTVPGEINAGTPNFLAGGGLPAGTGTLNTYPNTPTGLAAQRLATSAYLPNQVTPYSENFNLTVQRSFGSAYTAEIQYLGTRGIHLPTQVQLNVQPKVNAANQLFTDLNPADATAGATVRASSTTANNLAAISANSRITAPFAAAGFNNTITSYQPYSQSNYNGLGLNLTRRFQNGLQMNASYTWSKAMDDATAEVFSTVLTPRRPQNSQNVAADYSRSALDRTHRLTVEVVYDLPYFKHSNYLLKNVVGNWEVAPIYSYESPEYVTVLSGVNSNLNGEGGGIDRTIVNPEGNKSQGDSVNAVYSSTLAGNCPATTGGVATPTVGGVLACSANLVGYTLSNKNPNAYYVQAQTGTLPTAGRNTLPSRPIDNFDLSALKRINITERFAFEFHAQAFNLLNHAQYTPGFPDVINTSATNTLPTSYQTVSSANFNRPGTVFTAHARTMQLTAKLIF